jgi:hypothetical protein
MKGECFCLQNLVKISFCVSCPSDPKPPVVSGVIPIAVLAPVWPSNGGPIIDLLHIIDGHIPTSPLQSYFVGLDKGDDVVVSLDGGHDHLGQFLGAVAGVVVVL